MASAQQQGEGPAPGGAVSGSGASPDQEKLQQLWRETSALYEKVADNPLRVADVRVTGAARTRRDVLQRELKRVKDATSLREVHAALEVALEHLGQLEAFRRVEAMIDAPDGGAVSLLVGWAAPAGPRTGRQRLRLPSASADCRTDPGGTMAWATSASGASQAQVALVARQLRACWQLLLWRHHGLRRVRERGCSGMQQPRRALPNCTRRRPTSAPWCSA